MKKIFLIIFLSLLFSFFIPNLVWAGGKGCPTEGLVPCGSVDTCPCELCDFFVMLDRIIDRLLIYIVPSLAALMIAIGGFMYIVAYLSSGEILPTGGKGGPKLLSQAKRLFASVIFGLLIIYSAWVIIGLFLMTIGLADGTKGGPNWQDTYKSWWDGGFFEIPCP